MPVDSAYQVFSRVGVALGRFQRHENISHQVSFGNFWQHMFSPIFGNYLLNTFSGISLDPSLPSLWIVVIIGAHSLGKCF